MHGIHFSISPNYYFHAIFLLSQCFHMVNLYVLPLIFSQHFQLVSQSFLIMDSHFLPLLTLIIEAAVKVYLKSVDSSLCE